MDDRQFFDKLAPIWDDNEVRSTSERVNRILDFMNFKPGDSVLDLGTGTGVLLPYIAARIGSGGKITAVDFSKGMLARAREKFSDLEPLPEFIESDFENETLPGSYDHIILYCVYPHLHTPVDTLKWLRSVNLNEGGLITIAFPSDETFINNIHKERHSESGALLPAGKLAAMLREEGLDAEVANADADSYIINIRKGRI